MASARLAAIEGDYQRPRGERARTVWTCPRASAPRRCPPVSGSCGPSGSYGTTWRGPPLGRAAAARRRRPGSPVPGRAAVGGGRRRGWRRRRVAGDRQGLAPLLDGIETHPCALRPGSPWRASRRSSATRGARTVNLCPVGFARLPFVEGDAERAALLVGAAEGMRRRAALGVWPSLRRGEAELTAASARRWGLTGSTRYTPPAPGSTSGKR
jgi:hypothetical protein